MVLVWVRNTQYGLNSKVEIMMELDRGGFIEQLS